MNIKQNIIRLYEKIYASAPVMNLLYFWNNRNYRLKIMTSEESIRYILKANCSIARFGEGEFEMILQPDCNLGFQHSNVALSQSLEDVLQNKNKDLLICIPYALNNLQGRTKHSRMFWFNWGLRNQQHLLLAELLFHR